MLWKQFQLRFCRGWFVLVRPPYQLFQESCFYFSELQFLHQGNEELWGVVCEGTLQTMKGYKNVSDQHSSRGIPVRSCQTMSHLCPQPSSIFSSLSQKRQSPVLISKLLPLKSLLSLSSPPTPLTLLSAPNTAALTLSQGGSLGPLHLFFLQFRMSFSQESHGSLLHSPQVST